MYQTYSILQKLWLFIKLFTPMCITQFSLIGGTFIAIFLTGQYSTIDLAGVATGYNLWLLFYIFAQGTLLGITPIISQLLGAKKTDNIATIFYQGLYIGTGLACIILIIGLLGLRPLLTALNLEPAAAEVCISYLKAFAIGLFPLLWVNTLRNTVDSHGLTHYSMAIVFTSFIVNVFLNYSLIFGHFGFPEIGGVGAGYGIAGACWTNFILFSLVLLLHPKLKGYRIFKDFSKPSFHYIREQLHIGIPIGFSIFLEASIFSIAGLLMVHFGSAVVAAHQSVISFTNVFYCLPLSIAMASTIAVAYELGAGRKQEAIQYSYISRILAIVLAIMICTFTFTNMDAIADLFTNDDEVYKLIYSFLGYGVFFSAIDAIGTPLQGILRAYKDVKVVLYISLISYWGVCFPTAYILANNPNYGPFGVWIGLLASVLVAGILFTWRTWYIQRQQNK
ncbi:MAG: MATE family efflux transporter [Veillonella nakazawae]